MGVDISHIIKHDFHEVANKEAAIAFAKATIERLKKNLLLDNPDEDFELCNDGDMGISFQLPVYDVEFNLHNGFWRIESYFHYCQIVMHHGEYFWLRRLTFDIARALGQDEAWYAEEFYTWNSDLCEDPEIEFESWIHGAELEYGDVIPEFDQQSIMEQGDVHIPNYEPIYHDSFKECIDLYDSIQSQLPTSKLLGLQRTGLNMLRCEKNGQLFLIDENTLLPKSEEPIESMEHSLNGPEYIIHKNGLSAVFDAEGQQLTDFVIGRFEWRWENSSYPKRIIYNKEAGIELRNR